MAHLPPIAQSAERLLIAIEQAVRAFPRKPDQIIQPWQFGHYETKATHLWFRGVDPLIPMYRTPEECREALGLPAGTKPAARVHLMAPGPNRTRDRSATYPGIAAAMVRRWGLLNPPRQVAA